MEWNTIKISDKLKDVTHFLLQVLTSPASVNLVIEKSLDFLGHASTDLLPEMAGPLSGSSEWAFPKPALFNSTHLHTLYLLHKYVHPPSHRWVRYLSLSSWLSIASFAQLRAAFWAMTGLIPIIYIWEVIPLFDQNKWVYTGFFLNTGVVKR